MKKITEISEFVKHKKVEKFRQQVHGHKYNIGEMALVMDLHDQIDVFKNIALNEFLSAIPEKAHTSIRVRYLLNVADFIFNGVFLPFVGASVTVMMEEVGDKIHPAVTLTHVSLTELENRAVDRQRVKHNFSVTVRHVNVDKSVTTRGTQKIDNVTIEQPDWSNVPTNAVRRILKKANELALINGGVSWITKDGVFVVTVPHSEEENYIIVINGAVPFKLKEKPTNG